MIKTKKTPRIRMLCNVTGVTKQVLLICARRTVLKWRYKIFN